MLRTLSYLNLTGAVCYFLAYLQNGSGFVITGLLAAVVFQWLVLRSQERGQSGWSILHWLFAVLTLVFALYLGYGAFFLLLGAMEYQYYPLGTLLLTGSGFILMLSLLFHVFLSWRENLAKKDE
ncbi:hypothetical protein SAMN06265348_108237 [Pedobacter westerhofensis]|uniref:Uncharacterized protein n=1 Tax=Pedobacter westerhofensis TaxID=425512 RepID=A0A521EMF2_9SPHI|nr:hypothetical protein [Pedobacter westerhofensis]SMO84290.1 hypothetical protein SAMN06265348_108237 [Pedobacter westerhofensis]